MNVRCETCSASIWTSRNYGGQKIDKLTKEYDVNYPTWSVLIQRNFRPSGDDADEGDAYTNFGIMINEQVNFYGDGNDFKKWIKTNMSGTSIGRCIWPDELWLKTL